MIKKRKICVISSSRADYNHLYPLLEGIKKNKSLQLQIIVTGMHLLKEYNYSYKEIKSDGFKINAKIPTKQKNSTSKEIIKGLSVELTELYKKIDILKPDILVVLGDRYDILPVAIVAQIIQKPIAHIHGGEITQGAIDDSFRHSITKMSHLHFVSSKESKKRVNQLGENKKFIYDIGSLGVASSLSMEKVNKIKLLKYFKLKNYNKYYVITLHPETICENNLKMIDNLLLALTKLENYQFIFTASNSDTNSSLIMKRIRQFILSNKSNCSIIKSAGRKMYINLLRNSEGIIGNSSSGIIEAPALKIPTINIGKRQKGRPMANSIINCSYSINSIYNAIVKSQNIIKKNQKINTKYKRKNSVGKIIKILREINLDKILEKKFFDIN